MKSKNFIYATQQIWIKPGHRMFSYFQTMCENSKNLYNTTNFYIRQVYTSFRAKDVLHPFQQEVLETLKGYIQPMNAVQKNAYQKRLERELKKEENKRKKVKCNEFSLPDSKNPYVDYNFLDSLFKAMKQNDYKALPAQSSQSVMKGVFQNWASFFASLKDWKQNPTKYLGKPRIPRYSRAVVKDIEFTNQDCVIKENKFLKFPKTKEKLNIGKLGRTSNKLKTVRVIPKYDRFVVEMVFEQPTIEILVEKQPTRLMSIDLGVSNFATITTNTGMSPVLLKGNRIKSINQYYNKKRAQYYGILRQGKTQKEGTFTSKRLLRLDAIRHLKLKDLFHKASFFGTELASLENIDTIIIGQNKGWKQSIDIGKKNNQNFVQLPFQLFISMVTYKAQQVGISVEVAEESYTSKASFLDIDDIPTYGEEGVKKFSGRRISRGLYRSKELTVLNADVNGSANIMRKYHIKNGLYFHVEDVNTTNPLTYHIA